MSLLLIFHSYSEKLGKICCGKEALVEDLDSLVPPAPVQYCNTFLSFLFSFSITRFRILNLLRNQKCKCIDLFTTEPHHPGIRIALLMMMMIAELRRRLATPSADTSSVLMTIQLRKWERGRRRRRKRRGRRRGSRSKQRRKEKR